MLWMKAEPSREAWGFRLATMIVTGSLDLVVTNFSDQYNTIYRKTRGRSYTSMLHEHEDSGREPAVYRMGNKVL